jgi:hypothetical protein
VHYNRDTINFLFIPEKGLIQCIYFPLILKSASINFGYDPRGYPHEFHLNTL